MFKFMVCNLIPRASIPAPGIVWDFDARLALSTGCKNHSVLSEADSVKKKVLNNVNNPR